MRKSMVSFRCNHLKIIFNLVSITSSTHSTISKIAQLFLEHWRVEYLLLVYFVRPFTMFTDKRVWSIKQKEIDIIRKLENKDKRLLLKKLRAPILTQRIAMKMQKNQI